MIRHSQYVQPDNKMFFPTLKLKQYIVLNVYVSFCVSCILLDKIISM